MGCDKLRMYMVIPRATIKKINKTKRYNLKSQQKGENGIPKNSIQKNSRTKTDGAIRKQKQIMPQAKCNGSWG